MSADVYTVHLGFEVGTGKAVAIPLKHMVVTGQTQEAGKTTALEALIVRSGLRAVTFVTKRGEGAFAGGRRLQPFFRERADWVFVSSLIDATLGEKNKLLRAWLMKVCRGTKTLAEVQRNVIAAKEKARGFSESIYTEIEGYLELVVPQLAQLPPARKVEIGAGLNVMDLARYSTELQALVIRSVLEHVYEHEDGVVTVIPEAWEFLPEGRGSPVKREAEALIRKGAGLKKLRLARQPGPRRRVEDGRARGPGGPHRRPAGSKRDQTHARQHPRGHREAVLERRREAPARRVLRLLGAAHHQGLRATGLGDRGEGARRVAQ